jgi:formylglycine-generating enzyme required for sulfatase activity
MPRRAWLLGLAGAALVAAIAFGWDRARGPQHCADGMVLLGARCCGVGQSLAAGRCVGPPERCAPDLAPSETGCVAHPSVVRVEGGTVRAASGEWEILGAKEVSAETFFLDRHEVTAHAYARCVAANACAALPLTPEPGLPVSGITFEEAQRYCRWSGGALPTAQQHALAAMGRDARRFPWGQTGAVCRRAAFGLVDGPCASGGTSPELAGARPSGTTPDGIHDLAGNVAEWTLAGAHAQERGGSWRSAVAWELATWQAKPLAPDTRRDDLGFRCAYGAVPP